MHRLGAMGTEHQTPAHSVALKETWNHLQIWIVKKPRNFRCLAARGPGEEPCQALEGLPLEEHAVSHIRQVEAWVL